MTVFDINGDTATLEMVATENVPEEIVEEELSAGGG
jgi:hypothetical protein